MVQMKLKRKYTKVGKGQVGYRPSGGGGDSTKRRPNYKKCSDKQKMEIRALQPKMIMVMDARGKTKMVRENA